MTTAERTEHQDPFAVGSRIRVRDEEWRIRRAEQAGKGFSIRCVGVSDLVRGHEAIFLTDLEDSIESVRVEETKLVEDDSPSYRRSRLYLESLLRQTPPTDARLWRGHRGAMRLAPYQLRPAAKALRALRPRILIADAVGLGKTLEVGVLLSELIARGRGDRILVVAMKSVLAQFQKELWTRFTIPLMRLDSDGLDRIRQRIPSGKNPFHRYKRAIISIDTLKNEREYRFWLESCTWDAVVIDECHNAINAGTSRNRLAELLATRTEALILTSATPHNGKPRSFATLMNMLEPTAIANPDAYTRDDIKGLYERRFRKDVEHEVGGSFRERDAKLCWSKASDAEEKVFAALESAHFTTLNRVIRFSKHGKPRDVLFRTTLLKSFLSSPKALHDTLQERLKHLRALIGSDPESDKWNADVQTLEGLIDLVSQIDVEKFSKLQELIKKVLPSLKVKGKPKDPRVVIFSERIATLELLAEELGKAFNVARDLEKPGDGSLALLTGSEPDAKIREILESFGSNDGKVRILLASDVVSEGINLHHFCSRLIHFDVPWSLIRLEQRNGRIDRYGQSYAPQIRYLLTSTEVEKAKADLQVVEKLLEKERNTLSNLGDEGALLGLYDPAREEDLVASTISSGADLDNEVAALQQERKDATADDEVSPDWLESLLEQTSEEIKEGADTTQPSSLFSNDAEFFREALDVLAPTFRENDELMRVEWNQAHTQVTFVAPADLRERFEDMPQKAGPAEGRLNLSTSTEDLEKAIAKSRDRKGSWPEAQYLWAQHPAVEWAADRVSVLFGRQEAPVIKIPDMKTKHGFDGMALMEGVLSNQNGQSVVVRWFGLPTQLGATPNILPQLSLDKVLEVTKLPAGIPNSGRKSRLLAELDRARAPWREHAERIMTTTREERRRALQKQVVESERALAKWKEARLAAIEEKRATLSQTATGALKKQHLRLAEEERVVISKVKDRKDWLDKTFTTDARPNLRLIAVFVAD